MSTFVEISDFMSSFVEISDFYIICFYIHVLYAQFGSSKKKATRSENQATNVVNSLKAIFRFKT